LEGLSDENARRDSQAVELMSEAVARAMMSETRRAAVERAVKTVALAVAAREQTLAEVIAALTKATGEVPTEATPREAAAAARQSRRLKMVNELIRLEQQGRGRGAVSVVARDNAFDRDDQIEVDSLERQLRRWSKKRGQCPSAV
jgi:hypothetical protein